ncbi:MAG: acetylornithine deacetylase [bacterium]
MELQDLAGRLIGFNTVSPESSTVEMADFISNYLEPLGFTIERYPYISRGTRQVNLVARKGGEKSFLALAGHMDTVPFQASDWSMTRDPLKLVRRSDKFYARGVSDMKLFLAMAMRAGESIPTATLKKPFALVFTSEEEIGCIGARKLVREQKVHLGEYVVIGEPTEMVPVHLHKGYMYIIVELRGEKGHSSDPRKGKNVIELALPTVLNHLLIFQKKLESTLDRRFDPPYSTMNIGAISTPHGAKNIVPSYCRIELDIRPMPGQNPDDLFSILKAYVEHGLYEMTGIKVKVSFGRKPSPPMETTDESLFMQTIRDISGKNPIAVSFNTEGGIFNEGGCSSVIWGPGSIRQAHRSDEFVTAKYLEESMIEQYTTLIRRLCC